MDRDEEFVTARSGHWLILGLMGIVFPAVILVCFTGFKILGIRSIAAVFPLSIATTLAGSTALMIRSGFSLRRSMVICLEFLSAIAVSVVLAGLFYDVSKDGRWYHQEAVIRLADGYNPVRDTLEEDSIPGGVWSVGPDGSRFESAMLWVNHYPKGSEILAACVYSDTGDIETGKLFNFLLLFTVSALLGGGLVRAFPTLALSTVRAITALAILCPVVIAQSWTYYVDGQMHLLQLALGVLLILAVRERRVGWMVLAGIAMVLLVNLKFTGIVNALVFDSLAIIYLFLHGRVQVAMKFLLCAIVFMGMGIGIVGFNPYVKNFLEKGHPLYPLMGNHRMDIMTVNATPKFIAKNRLTKFLISMSSPTSHLMPLDGSLPAPKIPFSIRRAEIEDLSLPDPRLAGFGPFYAPLLFLSGLLYLGVWFVRIRRVRRGALRRSMAESATWIDWCVLAIGATALANPEFWWARYVPQLWLLPPLFVLSAFGHLDQAGRNWMSRIAFGVFLFPILLLVPVLVLSNLRDSIVLERDLHRLQGVRGAQVFYGTMAGDRAKFLDRGIHLQAVRSPDLLAGRYSQILLCAGTLSHSDPILDSTFHSSSPGISKNLIVNFCRHRLFWFL